MVGESFDRTNADTYGYGRLFFDRAYSLRMYLTANDVSASVFNALGSQFEAEEQIVWQADYRRITMVQPPRAFVIGVRIER